MIKGKESYLNSDNRLSRILNSSDSVFENLLTMDELLTMLKHQYSVYTVYRWVQRGKMPHKRIRGKLWFPKAEVIQWLERS